MAETTLDPGFKHEVANQPGGENIRRCFTCGTCTAGCPVRGVDEKFNPRKIIRMVLLGMKERVLKSDLIWRCSACYTCHERCPQDVRITDVMSALRNLAVKEGHLHPGFRAQVEPIGEFGRVYELDEFDNKKRGKLGLPAFPTECDAASRIFEATGLKALLVK